MSESSEVVNEVIDGRRGVYGEPGETYPRIAAIWSALLGQEDVIKPWHVPLLFIAAKMVRTVEAPDYSDNSDDIEGYLAIFRELMGEDMVHARSVTEYLEKKTSPIKERCHAATDGECNKPERCPQIRDGEPKATGRHCPLDTWEY